MCALDVIRRDRAKEGDERLGETPFRIGLWVGRRATPNTTDQAREAVKDAHGDQWRGGYILVALASRPTDSDVLLAFYRSVRPVGFWARTATLAGDDPASVRTALGSTLLATVGCAASLFLTLVGVSKLILPQPDEAWLWPVLCLLGAMALVPLWWRGLTAQSSDLEPSA